MHKQAPGGGKTERFRALMAEHGLKVKDVAALTGRNRKTVNAWMKGEPYAIPQTVLELLELKLAQRPNSGGAEQ